jgi:regulator of replication initiation timing
MRLRDAVHQQFFYAMVFLVVCFGPVHGWAQERGGNAPPSQETSLNDSIRQLQMQIQQLQTAVRDIKEEAGRYRAETLELKHELEATRQKLDSIELPARAHVEPLPSHVEVPAAQDSQSGTGAATDKSTEGRLAKLEEDQQLLGSKVEEQYQTKVESASKYRIRLFGMLLTNVFSNTGYVDHFEVPGVALPVTPSLTGGNTGGSFGATIRQSQLGLEVHGPNLAGARTRGDFVVDFFGEFPETINGAASGGLHVRTGTMRLDWSRTSVVGGTDDLFFSPTYPTSFASLGIPAFSYSGNIWAWMPQVRVEHRLIASDDSTLTLSGGILDPLTGEAPPNEFLRLPGAGESARQPAYAARLEWSHKISGQPMTLGVGGYYSRENWGFNRNVDGWVSTADWNVPFGQRFSLSGKFYHGRGIGGLGAGIGRSALFNGPLSDPATTVRGLTATGGWAQLKYKPATKWEFNMAAGQDGATAGDMRGFAAGPGYFAANLTRNRSELGNLIYRPRSNLLLSAEFRTLRTFSIDGSSQRANQLNLIMGVFF